MKTRGMIVNCDGTYYEILSTRHKNSTTPPKGYSVRRIIVSAKDQEALWVFAKIRDKETGRLKGIWKKVKPGDNEYDFIQVKPRNTNTILTRFHVNRRFLDRRKVDLRLSLNNMLGLLFLGRKRTEKIIETIIRKRIYGETQGKEILARDSKTGNAELRGRHLERPLGI
jgi:hypothetical protein